MRTRIIAAFPGTGKSHFYQNNKDICIDSDSSLFSWIKQSDGTKIRNPSFPRNYLEHIRENIGNYKYIFVSTHMEVRNILLENCLFFYLLYPQRADKEKYINRYIRRGSPEVFVDLLSKSWDDWIWQCESCQVGCKNIQMSYDYLSPELMAIKRMENGEC